MKQTKIKQHGTLSKVEHSSNKFLKLPILVFIAVIFIFGMHAHKAEAFACASAGTGNWSAAATWTSCNSTIPQPGDTVSIGAHTVTLDTSTNVASISIATGGTLIHNSTVQTITLTGTSGVLFTKTGTFTPSTFIEVIVTSASGTPTLLSAATTFFKLTINSTATVINSGAFGTTISGTGSKLYIQAGVFNPSGGALTGPGATGTFQIDAGATLCLGGTTASTNATCNSGASQTTARTMPTFQTYTFAPTSNVRYLSDAATAVSSTPAYGNLLIVPKFVTTARTYTLGNSALTINGDFTINADESSTGTPALTANAGGNITVAGTTTITRTNSATASLRLRPSTTDYNLSTGYLNVATGGTLSAVNTSYIGTITLTGTTGTLFTRAGTFTQGNSTVLVSSASGTPTLLSASTTFHILKIASTATVINQGSTIVTDATAGNMLWIASGVLNQENRTITGGTAGTLQIDAGGTLCLGGTTGATNATCDSGATQTVAQTMPTFTTYTLDPASTVRYLSDADVIMSSTPAYGNLIIDPVQTATRTFRMGGTFTVNGTLTLVTGTLTAYDNNSSIKAFSSSNTNTRAITMGLGTWTLTGTGTVWDTSTTTGLTISQDLATIKITDTSSTAKIFSGGGDTYYNIWYAPGAGTGSLTLLGSNTFKDFKDDGTSAHSLLFTAGTTTTVETFTVSGNTGQLISINSGDGAGNTSTATHALTKTGGGMVSSDYLNIQHSAVLPLGAWYAGVNSVNNQSVATAGSGWTFGTPPSDGAPYGGTAWAIPGTIQAESYNLGGEGISYHDITATNTGGVYRLGANEGVDLNTLDASYAIISTEDGEWVKYSVNVSTTGLYGLLARVATTNTGNTMTVAMDGVTIGTVAIPNTGAFGSFQTVPLYGISLTAGTHIMQLTMNTGVTSGFNLNYVTFTSPTPYGGTARTISGTIQAEDYDVGGELVAYHDNDAGNQGVAYRTSEGVDVETVSDTGGGYDVGWTNAGEWMNYTVTVQTTATYSLLARVASISTGKSFQVQLDGSVIATVNVPQTGGYQTWQTVTIQNIPLTAGSHMLLIYNVTDGFNVNYLRFNTSPTANAGVDQSITLPTTTTTLNGSGTDTDGTISSYAWSFISGPATPSITSATSASTGITGLSTTGTYVFRLTVTDNLGATGTDDINVVVNAAANVSPTANAGVDQTIALPTSTTTLNGSGTDTDGTIASYAWSFISGPATPSITSATSASTGITGLSTTGTYVFRLTVTDNLGATGTDDINVVVNPDPSTKLYYIDFGLSTNQTSTTGWNNLNDTTTGGPTLTLVDSTGAATTRTLHITDSFYYNSGIGMDPSMNPNGTSSSTLYPASATGDSFFLGTVSSITDTSAQITVGSLNNSNTYDFKFYASRVAGDAGNRTTDYTIGATTVSLNATDNVDNTVSITGQSPSAGAIVININKNAAATFGYLGVLEITEHIAANSAPTANAGVDQTIALPTSTTTLNGSGTDTDGTIASYAWSFISGPATPSITSATSASTGITGLSTTGTYVFRLTVTDNLGATGTDDINVVVNASNVAPTANAGVDQTYNSGTTTATLSGSGSDTDGTIASYAWSFISGPATPSITSATSASTGITGLSTTGTYVFRLTVTDNLGATGTDDINVILYSTSGSYLLDLGRSTSQTSTTGWNNIIDPRAGSPTSLVDSAGAATATTFQITDSFYYDSGQAVDFSTNVNGTTTSTIYPSTATSDSLFLGTLNVTDNAATVVVSGLINSYTYDFKFYASRMAGDSGNRTTDYTISGTTVSLNVTDNVDNFVSITGKSPTAGSITINISKNASATFGYLGVLEITEHSTANIAPTANAGIDQSIQLPTTSVTLSGSGTDSDGTIASYGWSFISGPQTPTIATPASASTSVTGLVSAGTYVFRLTVTDNLGATGTDNMNVVVSPSNISPTANAGVDQSVTMPVSSVTLSGSGSDSDGTIASYAWSEVSSNYATITSPTSASTTVTDLAAGTYTFRLTVTDNQGATGTDDMIVTVGNHSLVSPTAKTIVVLGSSTSAGYGLTPSSDSYVNRFATYFDGLATSNSVVNLAVGGYTTYQILPTGSSTANRPAVDTTHNITQALTYNPAAILVNMPSNDTANGYSTTEQETNFQTLASTAAAANVPIYFTTTQPRNNFTAGQVTDQTTVRDWILSTYGSNAIDFWTTFAMGDGTINPTYDQGDGIHLNNIAHKKLYARVAESTLISRVHNNAPTANAGVDQSITLPTTTTTLNGSGTDTDGTISSYAWSFISGPATPSITSATSASTGITGLSTAGTYVFRLTVTDNLGGTATNDINIFVNAAGSTISYLIDFGKSTNQTATTGWNNIISPNAGSATALVTSTGGASSTTLQITDSFIWDVSQPDDYWINPNGTTGSSVYPASATGDSFFLGTFGVTDTSATLVIGGLNNSSTYDFRFYASRVAGDAGNRTADYTIGATTVSLNATDNINNYVDITGKSPTAGSITVSVAKNAAATYGYLGVLEITEHNAAPVTNCTSQVASGNWSATGTWSCSHVPIASDDVTISTGHTITTDTSPNVLNTITVNGTLNTAGYDFSGATLSIGASGTLNAANVWQYYKAITIDHTKVPNSDLTNFPVVINGTYTDLRTVANGGHVANTNGYDIQFFSNQNLTTKLKWEIETYNPTTGQLVAWVKVPSLSHTADTVIYMAYGNTTATTDQSDKTNVWDSYFTSVWHMDDTVSGNNQTVANSTANSEDLTTHATTTYSGTQVASPVGYGLSTVQTSGDYLSFPQVTLSGDWSIEGWAYLVSAPDQYNAFFGNGSTGGGLIYNTNWYAGQYRAWNGTAPDDIVATTAISAGSWHHFVITRSGTALAAYVDGNPSGTTANGKNAIFQQLAMDGNGNASKSLQLDEVRISTAQRSADWIKTEYNNQNTPSTFYAMGSETAVPSATSTISLTGNWTNSGTFNGTGTTIKMTDNSGNPTFAGGNATYTRLWLAPGSGTGSYTISGNNTFGELKDDGTAAHTIKFTAGSTQTIATWSVSGSAGQLITINSTNTGTHALVKNSGGAVNADYLNIQHSVATPSYGIWFAGSHSVNNQLVTSVGSGWFFQLENLYRSGGSSGGGSTDNGAGSCVDGVQNGNETGTDSGGRCAPLSGTCSDGVQNGNETGIDTGGRCGVGGGGSVGGVDSGAGTCTDQIQNGDETGIDTGGRCAPLSGTCSDGIKNGNETGIDTGGRCGSGGGGDSGFIYIKRNFALLEKVNSYLAYILFHFV